MTAVDVRDLETGAFRRTIVQLLPTKDESRRAEALRPRMGSAPVANLQEELNRSELRAEAADAIRSLIEGVRLVSLYGKLGIDLAGNFAGILALAAGKKKPVSETRDGLHLFLRGSGLVAGGGFEPPTFRL